MYFNGIIIAVITFIAIGAFHPIVIKCEYYFSCKIWPIFLVCGIVFVVSSLYIENAIMSAVLGVTGCSCFWSIRELFEQKERVRKGWFPKNPRREIKVEKKIGNDNSTMI